MPIPIPRALARLNRDVRLFMVSAVATGVCYTGLYFLLINLYLLRMGYGVEFIGVFISTGAFSFALFSLPAGAAGRRWGSRRPMIFGVCVLSFGLAMLALSALLPAAWQPIWQRSSLPGIERRADVCMTERRRDTSPYRSARRARGK